MKKNLTMRWFTLVETAITIVIIGILVWVVFETYLVIGRIAVFVRRQSSVHNEMIYLTQVMQNLVDNQNVVLTWTNFTQLSATNWFVNELHLQDNDHYYTFSRECENDSCYANLFKRPLIYNPDNPADVALSSNTPLTWIEETEITQFVFKIIPYEEENTFAWTMHDGFWMFIEAQSPFYSETDRRNRVDYQWQLFFNPRKY